MTNLNIFKEWLTPIELESELGISVGYQSKLRMKRYQIKDNPLPFTKIGRKILYNRHKIEEWLENNTQNVKDVK